jgi:molybdate transport system substrate-binding protein
MRRKPMKNLLACLVVATMLMVCATAALGEATDAPKAELLVSAAASLTDVMPKIAEEYAKVAANVTLTFTYGASGTLQTQIEEGAPADVFISAGKKQMKALTDADLILADSAVDLLENKVVLIVPKDSQAGITTFEDVASDKVKMIALGEPSSVPAGQYSQQVFTSLGIWDAVSAKANFGSDVRQVLTWVENGEVDCGVVYATDAMTSDQVTVAATAPVGSCDKIIYPAAVVKSSAQPDAALAFLAFLQTEPATAVFKSFGFALVVTEAK